MAFVATGHGRPPGSPGDFLWLVAIVATGRKFSEVNCSLLAVIWRSVTGVYGIVKAFVGRSGTRAVYGLSGRGVYGIDMTPDICKTADVSFLWTHDPATPWPLRPSMRPVIGQWPPTQSIALGVSIHGDNARRAIWIVRDNASHEEWRWGGRSDWHKKTTVRIPVSCRAIATSGALLWCWDVPLSCELCFWT